jgi:hypothetical protein
MDQIKFVRILTLGYLDESEKIAQYLFILKRLAGMKPKEFFSFKKKCSRFQVYEDDQ